MAKIIEYKNLIEKMMEQSYPAFVKALISIEIGIDDEAILDGMYWGFMENDGVQLIDSYFYSKPSN